MMVISNKPQSIDPGGFSYTEGTWTLANVQLLTMGYRDTNYELYKIWTRACIRGGYLYTFSYKYDGIYKICLTNPSDITLDRISFNVQRYVVYNRLSAETFAEVPCFQNHFHILYCPFFS